MTSATPHFQVVEVTLTAKHELELISQATKTPVTRVELAEFDILILETVNRLKQAPVPSMLQVYPIVGGKPWPAGVKWNADGKVGAIPGLCVAARKHRLFIGNALPDEDITYKFDYEVVINSEIGGLEKFAVDPELVIKKGGGGLPPCDSFLDAVDNYKPPVRG